MFYACEDKKSKCKGLFAVKVHRSLLKESTEKQKRMQFNLKSDDLDRCELYDITEVRKGHNCKFDEVGMINNL